MHVRRGLLPLRPHCSRAEFRAAAIMTPADAEALPNNEQPFDRVASLPFPSYQPPGVFTAFRS
jgi:hypothetical protein